MDYSSVFIIKKILQTSVLTVLNKTHHPSSKLYLRMYICSLPQKKKRKMLLAHLVLMLLSTTRGTSSEKRLGEQN